MKKLSLSFAFVVLLSFSSRAQGLYMSQQRFVPLLYNPANPAATDQMGIMLNYRNQQARAADLQLQTFAVNALKPFYTASKERRWGGIGLSVLSDKALSLGTFSRSEANLSLAYNLPLAGSTYLSIGVQGGYAQQRVGLERATTGSQWVPNMGHVPGASNGEEWQNRSVSYWTLGSGLLLYREKAAGGMAWSLGASAYGLNEPTNGLLSEETRQPVNYRAHAMLEVLDRSRFSLVPDISAQVEAGRQLWSLGSLLKYKFENENPFDPLASGSLNLLSRATLFNTLVLGLQLEQPHYVLGVSYDWGFGSQRNNQASTGAAEFGISLRKAIGRKKAAAQPKELGQVRDLFEQAAPGASTNPGATTGNEEKSTIATQDNGGGALAPGEYQGEGVSFALRKDFSFAFDDASLQPESKQWLDELYELLQNNPHMKLQVIGHTDDVGTRKANQQVSEQRARAVHDYLLEKGLAAERIRYEGRGASEPLVPNHTEAQRAQNRRVDFVLYTQGE